MMQLQRFNHINKEIKRAFEKEKTKTCWFKLLQKEARRRTAKKAIKPEVERG